MVPTESARALLLPELACRPSRPVSLPPFAHRLCSLTLAPPPPAGPNGCGKSTLLKALCGVHPLQGGSVQLPPAGGDAPGSGVVFVPQRPLVAPGGALWQQLCYPGGCAGSLSSSSGDGPAGQQQAAAHSSGSSSQQHAAPARPRDSELLAVLQLVGLQYLLNRVGGSFEAAADWAAMLSPGELQRLSVARVLLRWGGT